MHRFGEIAHGEKEEICFFPVRSFGMKLYDRLDFTIHERLFDIKVVGLARKQRNFVETENFGAPEERNNVSVQSRPSTVNQVLKSIASRYTPKADTPSFAITRLPGFGIPIVEGMSVSLKCEVDSNPVSTPIWQRDNGLLPVEQSDDGWLNFTKITRAESGWYKCYTRHMLGIFTSIGYFLNVRCCKIISSFASLYRDCVSNVHRDLRTSKEEKLSINSSLTASTTRNTLIPERTELKRKRVYSFYVGEPSSSIVFHTLDSSISECKCNAMGSGGGYSAASNVLRCSSRDLNQWHLDDPDMETEAEALNGEATDSRRMEVQIGGAVTLECDGGCWGHGPGMDPVGGPGPLALSRVVYQEAGEYRCVAPDRKMQDTWRAQLPYHIKVTGRNEWIGIFKSLFSKRLGKQSSDSSFCWRHGAGKFTPEYHKSVISESAAESSMQINRIP
ncbi:hypothetical protein HZH66_003012 [Vespula vulgaris]|uniref:Ig-like domain-containing protein n=1 Tax=Vespula vulgaris TaxID=7454 RepID=A0A834KKU5_VESVU|nr:hypothetical protein HZH66_003012 [Vespula vulgaris]